MGNYVTLSGGTLYVTSSSHVDVTGGNDTVTIGQNDIVGVQGGNNNTISVGTGSTVYLNGGTNNVVTATGTDKFVIGGAYNNAGTTINASGSGNSILANGADLSTISFTGIQTLAVTGGAVKVTAAELSGLTTINAQDASDTIYAANSGIFSLVGKNLTGIVTLYGSSGNDTLSAGATGQTLTGGGGSDTLVGFINGGTTFTDAAQNITGNTIQNFIASDQILIKDLGFGTASLGFTEDSSNNFGTLNVSDGTHSSAISMTGQFNHAGFYATTNGAGGTQIGYLSPSDPGYASFHSAHPNYLFG